MIQLIKQENKNISKILMNTVFDLKPQDCSISSIIIKNATRNHIAKLFLSDRLIFQAPISILRLSGWNLNINKFENVRVEIIFGVEPELEVYFMERAGNGLVK